MKLIRNLKKTKRRFSILAGKGVIRLLVASILLGILWFLVEISFLGVFQVFLYGLGLIQNDQLKLPMAIPKSIRLAAVVFLIYGLLRSFVSFFRQYYSGIIAQTFIRQHRIHIFQYALRNLKIEAAHSITSVFTERVVQTGVAVQNLSSIIASSFAFLALFAVGFRLAPPELVCGILAIGLLLLPFRKLSASTVTLGGQLAGEWDQINKNLAIGLKNQFFLRIYGGIDGIVTAGVEGLKKYESVYRQYIRVTSFKATLPSAYGLGIVSVISVISVNYFHRDGVTMIAFFYIFMRMAQSIGDIGTAFGEIRFYSPAFVDIYRWQLKTKRFFNHEKMRNLRTNTIKIPRIHQLSGANIGFGYGSSHRLFKNLNFSVKKGEVLLIKGESGVGKSTLLSLILGMQNPLEGVISYNEMPALDCDLSYLDLLAYVGPEPYIVPGTVRENLLFGHQDPTSVTEGQMWEALNTALVKTDVEKLRLGLEENLREHAQLSSGQKQRISIARAFLRSPDVLILDEATANLDPITEGLILKNLSALKQEMILVVVSHKMSFDDLADVKIHMTTTGTAIDSKKGMLTL